MIGRWRAALVALLIAGELWAGIPARTMAAELEEQPAAISAANNDQEIVYIDSSGFIRVLDSTVISGSPQVQWVSPTGGWTSFALGDFNADGDQEIVAVGPDGINGKLAVFDPVVTGQPSNSAGVINGIAWDTLYQLTLSRPPRLVATGEFNVNIPGDEIVYDSLLTPAERRSQDDQFRFVILQAANQPPDGRGWQQMLTFDTGNNYTRIATGELDGSGVDEIAVVDEAEGNLSVYRVTQGQGATRIYRSVNQEREWESAAVGQFTSGGAEELAAVRSDDYPLPSLFVMHYNGADMNDVFSQPFVPGPNIVFFADIAGNGDKEAVVLRKVRQEYGVRPRLFVRDNGNEGVTDFESELDVDNGYQAGAGGDVDGDGRDEIVVIRDNRIRIFTEPERSGNFEDHDLATDQRTIAIGNLDANGVIVGESRFGASPSNLAVTLAAGETDKKYAIALSDVSGGSIPFDVSLQNNATWATVQAAPNQTPATINITFNTSGLAPGVYSDQIVVNTSDAQVKNRPYNIDVSVTVQPGVAPTAASLLFVSFPCAGTPPTQSQTLSIQGTQGITYTAGFVDAVDWANVNPTSGQIPSQVTVAVDPTKRPQDAVSAKLRITGRAGSAATETKDVSVTLLCAQQQLFLPVVQH